ncbi:MAG: response regulator [Anaeromyxobacteraceae bacterium]
MSVAPLRVLVVEDEPLSRERLADLLAAQPGVEVVARAENGRLGLEAAARHRPDAIFLDVEMPGMKGTDVMHALPPPRPAVVFVTAFPEHAVEAFAGGAVHYLLKPVSRVGVAQALSRLRPEDDPLQDGWLRIPARRRGGTRLLRPGEVEALVADLGDCAAWTAEGVLPVDGTLAHWEERLQASGFVRVHRNALVRLAAVREITAAGELVLAAGRIAVSRRRIEEIRRRLGG